MTLAEVHALFPGWFLRLAAFLFGLLWGSFLNVVIYRVPREMSVSRPASRCPGCETPIAPYDNIPVLSYVILRGRARCCGARMSPRYPLVELLGGALSLAVYEVAIRWMPVETDVLRALAVYGSSFALCLGLVAAVFIDAEHMFLPDSITLGGLVLGVATASLRDLPYSASLIGAAVGFGLVWFPFVFLYGGLRGRSGMGMGDAKLVALAGAWFGWQGAVFALFAGALQGSLYAGALKVLGIELKLPQAVLDDIAALEKAAAEGDEDAKRELAEDPLTQQENPWLLQGIRRVFGLPDPDAADAEAGVSATDANANAEKTAAETDTDANANAEKADAEADTDASANVEKTAAETDTDANTEKVDAKADTDANEEEAAAPSREHLPFGPFLSLAILELLLAGEWLQTQLPVLLLP